MSPAVATPGGFTVELCTGMTDYSNGLSPRSTTGWNSRSSCTPRGRSRTGTGQRRSTSKCLGCKASDWIGNRAGFFRSADRYHHSLAQMQQW